MIFAFLDDRTLLVHEALSDVVREHEAIDVENGDVRFFDADGHPLEPVFTEPNKRRKLLGVIDSIQQGQFTLKPTGADSQEFRSRVLREATYLEANPWFATLDDLRAHFLSS